MKTATKVIFYNEGSSILAVFPEESEIRNTRTCYAHIGQHSVSMPDYHEGLEKASEEQFADLQTELESIGYFLEIINY